MSVADYVLGENRCVCCGQAKRQHWTPQLMVDALNAWMAEHGKLPRSTDWTHGKPDHPPAAFVIKVFGKWNNLVRAAGHEPFNCGQRGWTKDEIAEAMLDCLMRTGRWPSSDDWCGPILPGEPRRPYYASVYRAFGSWNAAKLYAGFDPDASKRRVAEPKCAECGTDLENNVIGCHTCSTRADNRARRLRAVAAKNGTPLSVVEPLPGSDATADGGLAGRPVDLSTEKAA